MNIITKINDNVATILMEGWLDTTTAPQLGEELDKLSADISNLILDFEKLEYISSAGLRQIVVAYQKMGNDKFKIINTNPEVMEVFKMTGFDKKLDIEMV